MAYSILVPQQEMEPVSPALEALSLNHWTARKVPFKNMYNWIMFYIYVWQSLSFKSEVSLIHICYG